MYYPSEGYAHHGRSADTSEVASVFFKGERFSAETLFVGVTYPTMREHEPESALLAGASDEDLTASQAGQACTFNRSLTDLTERICVISYPSPTPSTLPEVLLQFFKLRLIEILSTS